MMNVKFSLPTTKEVVSFVKDNRWMLTRMGLEAVAFAVMPDGVSFAQSGTTDDTISVITEPLDRMEKLMLEPVPKAIVKQNDSATYYINEVKKA